MILAETCEIYNKLVRIRVHMHMFAQNVCLANVLSFIKICDSVILCSLFRKPKIFTQNATRL